MVKSWVRFVAVQRNSATLMYDLNTMTGTVESYLKNSTAIPNSTGSKPEKSHLVLKVSVKSSIFLESHKCYVRQSFLPIAFPADCISMLVPLTGSMQEIEETSSSEYNVVDLDLYMYMDD